MDGKITNIKQVFTTEDAWLAAAMITLGCAPYSGDGGAIARIVRPDGQEQCLFIFAADSRCDDLARKWAAIDKLREAEPEHPLSYCHAMMHNRQRIIDAVKQKRRLVFRTLADGRMAFATEKEITK